MNDGKGHLSIWVSIRPASKLQTFVYMHFCVLNADFSLTKIQISSTQISLTIRMVKLDLIHVLMLIPSFLVTIKKKIAYT